MKEKMEALWQMMNMEGWQVLREFLTNQMKSDMVALASPKRQFPDDFYRGRVDVEQWFLEALPSQVTEFFKEANAQENAGTTPVDDSVGHPYAEEEGQPHLEGEDMK